MAEAQIDEAVKHGRFLEERRLDLGLKWSEVARDMERLYGIPISADYLYKIKRGNAPLSKMSVNAREALRNILRISPDDWEAATNLYTPASELLVDKVIAGVRRQLDQVDRLTSPIDRVNSQLDRINRITSPLDRVNSQVDRIEQLTSLPKSPAPIYSASVVSAAARGYRVPKQEPPLSESLVEAVRLYGDNPEFAAFAEPRWAKYLNRLHHKRTPTTPEGWLALFLKYRDEFEPPEDDE